MKTESVPMLDLSRQYASIREEVLAGIERVCASQRFILGPEVEALESELAGLVGAKEAVGCASGTDALWLALAAAGIRPGDQVVTTPFSFFASASSIVRCGAEPVFVDVDPETLNLDPGKVRVQLERKTGFSTMREGSRSSQSRSARNDRQYGKDGKNSDFGRIRAILPVHL